MIIYRGGRRQRGHGIGGVFKSLFRKAMPILAEGGKVIAKHAAEMGKNVLADVSRGETDIAKSFERHGVKAAIGAAGDVLDAPDKRKKRRGGRLRTPQTKRLKGRKFTDIYDD